MKKVFILLFSLLVFSNCNTTQNTTKVADKPVRITNEELEYEIIIFDIGFETYLNSIAKPINFYSETSLENKNRHYVSVWNQRVRNPLQHNQNIYQNIIDYDFNTHYGLEVNHKLYNYFKFVEYKYGERF